MARACSSVFVVCLFWFCCSSLAITNSEHKSRVVNEELSKAPHDVHGEHNPQYDRDAFLGEDAKRFEDMTPEEGRNQLGQIVDKIDTNHDGFISSEELRDWLKKVNQRTMSGDIRETWKQHNLKDDESLTWEHYKEVAIGPDGDYEDDDEETRNSSFARDERRWKVADENGDGVLSKDEALAFFHPEPFEKMHDVIVENTVEELDRNKDGFVDLEEFVHDLWSPESGEEPSWVQSERDDFKNIRDLNKDGKLDKDEVKRWIFPDSYDHVETEVKHLFSECDADRDGLLTKKEVLDKYDLFVGSPVTNFGEVLSNHDEL
ncbi:unnamed protein product [Calicophoron daubneyi]|uniref:Reticulocalbin-3 n=1 Tax=Calicophoron daubneyi TaxID=300641 RepID=A0AAV2TIK7_CALDB